MIKLHTNNNYKKLYVNLLRILIDSDSVFSETWVVVPNHSAKQWLQKSLARDLGVCAHIQFILPLSFNWLVLKQVDESKHEFNVFNQDVLRWRILQRLYDDDTFKNIKQEGFINNFHLSEKIANILLTYHDERPVLMSKWLDSVSIDKGVNSWQKKMWQKILHDLDVSPPVELLKTFNSQLHFTESVEDLIFFGTEQLSTFQKETMIKLAQDRDIHVMISNPCPDFYWYDLKSMKSQARLALFVEQNEDLLQIDQPILASLGRSKMALFDAFLDNTELIETPPESQQQCASLLASVKKDISDLSEDPQPCAVDDSISIHSCHHRFREIEVVKDQVLVSLDNDHELNPEDIIVVAPDINDYVGVIRRVFHYDQKEPDDSVYIPYHIDRVRLSDHDYAMALMAILESLTTEMTASSIYQVLSHELILQKMNVGLDDLPRMKNWIINANIRQDYSADHKAQRGFKATVGNTWQFGEFRWLSGYLADDVDDTEFLSVYGGLSGQEKLFSQCFAFVKMWYEFYRRAQQTQSTHQWYKLIKDICQQLIFNDLKVDMEQRVLTQLSQKFLDQPLGCEHKVPLTIVHYIIKQLITENHYRSEGLIGVRFQTWENAFVVDAKLLIMVGLNDREFPKIPIKNDLDLFAHKPVRLNKSTRLRDKNLMLTALSENTEQLMMTYIGFNAKTNEVQSPSVVVDELIHYLQQKTAGQFAVKQHKMYGFNRSYFSDDGLSYNQHHWHLLRSYYAQKTPSDISDFSLTPHEQDHITLSECCDFFCDPMDYFLINQANIDHRINNPLTKDQETFYPDGLEQWQLRQHIFAHGKQHTQKTGLISDLDSGQMLLDEYENMVAAFKQQCEEIETTTHIIDINCTGVRITGSIGVDQQQQLITIEPSKASSKRVCQHWIKHLCYGASKSSYLYFLDKTIRFLPVAEWRMILGEVLNHWSSPEPWLFCPRQILNAGLKSTLKLLNDEAYHKKFIANANNHPSSGQLYFAIMAKAYNHHKDIEQFMQPLIDHTEFV